MKRFAVAFQLLILVALAIAVPQRARAETVSCTDQFVSCINAASKYINDGVLLTLAETECSFEYAGCVVRKLKFW